MSAAFARRALLKTGVSCRFAWRVIATERSDRVVEGTGLFEVADVTGARDDLELGVRDSVLELACDAERRARVRVAPHQQRRHGDAGQQIALVGLGHQRRLCLQARGTGRGGHLRQKVRELGRGLAGEQAGRVIALFPLRASCARLGDVPAPPPRGATLPPGVAAREDQRRHPLGVAAVELLHDRAALRRPATCAEPRPTASITAARQCA